MLLLTSNGSDYFIEFPLCAQQFTQFILHDAYDDLLRDMESLHLTDETQRKYATSSR